MSAPAPSPFADLAPRPQWVAWRYQTRNGKPTKMPLTPHTPPGERARGASSTDPATWGTYEQAEAVARRERAEGVGLVFGGDGLGGIDLDACYDPQTGTLADWARRWVELFDSYTEISPSGIGVKIFARGAPARLPANEIDYSAIAPKVGDKAPGLEAYVTGRYFTVTGRHLPGTPGEIREAPDAWDFLVEALRNGRAERASTNATARGSIFGDREPIAPDRCERNIIAGHRWNTNMRDLTAHWIGAGFSDEWMLGHAERFTLPGYSVAQTRAEMRDLIERGRARWNKPDPGASDHAGSAPADSGEPDPLVLDPRDPLPSARAFVERHHKVDGLRTLHHHRGEFFTWNAAAYAPTDEATIKAELYDTLAGASRVNRDGDLEPFRPNRAKIGDVLDALRAAANLPSSISPPAWLDEAPGIAAPPGECVVAANGILHMPTREIFPPTPALFTTSALPVSYDPDAPEPRAWLDFLDALWPDDAEAIDTLQEIFGYLLTADTRQQKAFLVVGPKRSGKGTIGRILTAMLGADNVAAPTLAGLATNFGIAPLIGKQVAMIADARLGGRADQQAIAERLLSISGEDSLTIDRKYLPAWTGRLPTRFLILTNELPRLADASGALASRFIVLTLEHSFYGREDHGLTDRLLRELPGILNWSLDGWHRLAERGYFVQPASAREAIDELETLGSPVGAFVRDQCVLGPGREIGVKMLYQAWRDWCEDHGRREPGTEQTFGRDLRAAVPGLKVSKRRDDHGGRVNFYLGIDRQ